MKKVFRWLLGVAFVALALPVVFDVAIPQWLALSAWFILAFQIALWFFGHHRESPPRMALYFAAACALVFAAYLGDRATFAPLTALLTKPTVVRLVSFLTSRWVLGIGCTYFGALALFMDIEATKTIAERERTIESWKERCLHPEREKEMWDQTIRLIEQSKAEEAERTKALG